MSDLRSRLDAGIDAMGLAVDASQRQQLMDYLQRLVKWNKAYNLTAIRDPAEMVSRHLLDSLSILPHLDLQPGESVIDVGTGGGLPGMVLAICRPELAFTLLDSNGKKTRFLLQTSREMGLSNVTVEQARVESFRPEAPFSVATTRAFASLPDILANSRHLLRPEGRVLAMKGAVTEEERAVLPTDTTTWSLIPLAVPGLEQEARHLVVVKATALMPGGNV